MPPTHRTERDTKVTDPTNLIDTYERAQVLAHVMLRLAPDPSPKSWQVTSEPLLSALLYAASPNQTGGGIQWVNDTVAALAIDNDDDACTTHLPNTMPSHFFLAKLDGLHETQRASIIQTLHRAVVPWLAA